MRLVTHHHITMSDADAVVAAFRKIFTSPVRQPAGAAASGSPY